MDVNRIKSFWVIALSAMLSLSACNFNEKSDDEDHQEQPDAESVEANVSGSSMLTTQDDSVATDSQGDALAAVEQASSDSPQKQADSRWEKRPVRRQADILHNKILVSARPIVERNMAELSKELAKYNIDISGRAPFQGALTFFPPYGEDLYCVSLKDDRCFSFALDQNMFIDFLTDKRQTLQSFNDRKQRDIENVIIGYYVKTMKDLKQSRVDISKPFACYYPILDLSDVPQEYQDKFCGYDPAAIRKKNSCFIQLR